MLPVVHAMRLKNKNQVRIQLTLASSYFNFKRYHHIGVMAAISRPIVVWWVDLDHGKGRSRGQQLLNRAESDRVKIRLRAKEGRPLLCRWWSFWGRPAFTSPA